MTVARGVWAWIGRKEDRQPKQKTFIWTVAVLHRQRPIEGDGVTVRFADGPLDRLSVPVATRNAAAKFIGWAMVTPTRCVQAVYRDASGNVRTFDCFETSAR